jgi:hypothetical protein
MGFSHIFNYYCFTIILLIHHFPINDMCILVTIWLFNVAMGNHNFLIGKSSKILYKWAIFHSYVK